MCPWVVFTLVVGKILFAGVPFDIIYILSHHICHPKISYFHRARSLSFDSFVCNADGGGVVAMDWCFWLGMGPILWGLIGKSCLLYNSKRGRQVLLLPLMQRQNEGWHIMWKIRHLIWWDRWPHALLLASDSDKYDALECTFIIMSDARNRIVAFGYVAR